MAALSRSYGEWGWLDDVLTRLVEGDVGVIAAVAGVLVAVGIGVVHAVGPGHGKVLVAAYLAGTDGRRRDAIALGGLVAAMHAGSVLAVGSAFVVTQRLPLGETLAAWIRSVIAVAIIAIGIAMLARARRVHRTGGVADGASGADGSEHDGHGHDGHDHPGLPLRASTRSRPGIVALAAAGGLLPSPAAFLVLVTAFAVGRPWYGLVLVLAFSIGMAATLIGVGLAVVAGRDRAVRAAATAPRLRRVVAVLPTLAAVAVIVGGAVVLGTSIAAM
jgi:nickel/cobalt transporter (NicO) family protein